MNRDFLSQVSRSRRDGAPTWFKVLFFAVFVTIVLWGLCVLNTGCTVTPAAVDAKAPSFDGNSQDSGFKGWAPDGSGILSPAAHARYVALVHAYGAAFTPALAPETGCRAQPDGTWLIDKEHLARFGEMAAMARRGDAP